MRRLVRGMRTVLLCLLLAIALSMLTHWPSDGYPDYRWKNSVFEYTVLLLIVRRILVVWWPKKDASVG